MLLKWDNSYSVKIKLIDEQHMQLVNLLNELHDSMKAGKSNDLMQKIFQNLANYVEEHFKTEEVLLTKYEYPNYLEHKKEHDIFRNKVKELSVKYKSGQTLISREILQFILDWVTSHILNIDKKYSDFLLSKGLS